MTPLDDYPADDAMVDRAQRMTDVWRRWLTRLLYAVRLAPVVLGGVTRRTSGAVAATWLQSAAPLPSGLYRVTASAAPVAGTGPTVVTLLYDDGTALISVDAVSVTGATVAGVVLRRLSAGTRLGYQIAGGHELDLEIVVEVLPAATRLA